MDTVQIRGVVKASKEAINLMIRKRRKQVWPEFDQKRLEKLSPFWPRTWLILTSTLKMMKVIPDPMIQCGTFYLQ